MTAFCKRVVLRVVLVAAAATAVCGQSLVAVLAAKEAALRTMASQAEYRHVFRCTAITGAAVGASDCSIAACGNDFSATRGFHCNTSFGSDTTACGATACAGLMRSTTDSVIRLAPGTDFADGDTQAFVHSTRALDATFRENLGSGVFPAWQYVGHTSGAMRLFPGNPQGRSGTKCDDYDSRRRPWYVAASSGPKDVVLVLDISGSMSWRADPQVRGVSRLDVLKIAVKALLDTLTQNDYVAIVPFGTTAHVLGLTAAHGTALVRATADTLTKLKAQVDLLSAAGDTNMAPALEKAFDLFAATTNENSGCTRVLQFLTDGVSTDTRDVAQVMATGQARLGTNKAIPFTYSMSSGADHVIPRQIACAHGGVWTSIADGADPLTAMSQYYKFMASGINSTTPRWTTPYEDAFGLGQMVSLALPLYDRTLSVPLLAGVFSTDITIAELRATEKSFTNVVNALIARSAKCDPVSVTDCQLQHLRQETGYTCPAPAPTIANCSLGNKIAKLTPCTAAGTLNKYLCGSDLSAANRVASPVSTFSDVACCKNTGSTCNIDSGSSNVGVIAGATVGGVVIVVGVIVGILFFIKCKRTAAAQKQEPAAEEQQRPAEAGRLQAVPATAT